jgi:RNA polymerase-binding transcription factor DksA
MAKAKQDKTAESTATDGAIAANSTEEITAQTSSVAKPAKDMPKSKPSTPAESTPAPEAAQPEADSKISPFLQKQKERLLALRDGMLDSMAGVAKDNLRSRAEGSEASAFGMHQADAGSDAYDRDFALSLLSQEQDALYEIEEALKRIEAGTYGICEMSGKQIPHLRLEAIPFARFTVECQSQIEKQKKATRIRQPVTSLFGLTDEEGGGEGDEEETPTDLKE